MGYFFKNLLQYYKLIGLEKSGIANGITTAYFQVLRKEN